MAVCTTIIAVAPASAQDDPVNIVLFGSMDSGPSTFINTGAKLALDDLGRDGFVALVNAGGGVRRERGPSAPAAGAAPTFLRATGLAAALGGYQIVRDWGAVAVFAGPEATVDLLIADRLRSLPPAFGLRLQGEAWVRPSADTLTTATLVLGSARLDMYGRLSAGYRLWGAYLGPEAAYYGDRTGYAKVNLGLHVTDFAFAGLRFRLAGGGLYETQTQRLGPYVALAAWAAWP